MADLTFSQLRSHEKRIAGMLADPECVGELLLVGIGMARSLDLGEPAWVDGSMPLGPIVEAIYGRQWLPTRLVGVGKLHTTADSNPYRRIHSVFHADRRRYDPDFDGGRAWHSLICGRPMIRRDGLCSRNATTTRRLADPLTGLRSWVGCCSQRTCKDWFAEVLARNVAELKAHPAPEPPANTGGVLERHMPEIDWWAVWRHIDKNWSPPPEGERFHRPKLTLVMTDPDEVPVSTTATRPALVVHDGGWR
jgi:hypothetical protein